MIKKLRKRFIRIAMIAVSVLFLLCVIVNVANIVSVNSELADTLGTISDNRGKFPKPVIFENGQMRPSDGWFFCESFL